MKVLKASLGCLLTLLFSCHLQGVTSQDDEFELVLISNKTIVDAGNHTVLICVAYYEVNANISMSWWKDDLIITNNSMNYFITEQDLFLGGRWFRSTSLQICRVGESDPGNYTCSVSNDIAEVTEDVELLVDIPPLMGEEFDLVLLSGNTTFGSGRGAVLVCVAFYGPDTVISMSWTQGGNVITNSNPKYDITKEDYSQGGRQFRSLFLKICSATESDSGLYTCVVSNGTSDITADIQLTVLAYEYSLVMPNGNSTEEGSSIAVCVTASGAQAATVYPVISFSGSNHAVFGEDFVSNPLVLFMNESQNMTCFNLTMINNSVYTQDYYIMITLHSVQMSDESTIIPYTNLKSIIISVDDSEDAGLPEPVASQLDNFIPFGVERGDSVLPLCSPTCAFEAQLPSSFPYFGRRYSKIIINGTLIGGFMEDTYSILLAPFWVGELAQTGNIFFNNMTEIPSLKEQIQLSFGMENYDALYYFYVTWYRVATSLDNPNVNTFQLILTTNGAESFAFFQYGLIDVSNFRNGFSSEQMIPDSSIEGSAALTGTNTLVNGQYLYKIDAFPVMSPTMPPVSTNETETTTANSTGEGLTTAEIGGAVAGAAVATAAVAGTAVIAAKVGSSLLKKPPLPNLESQSPPDNLGQEESVDKSKERCCKSCLKKMLNKLKQCLCRKKKRKQRNGKKNGKAKKNGKDIPKKKEGAAKTDESTSQTDKSKIESSLKDVIDNEYMSVGPITSMSQSVVEEVGNSSSKESTSRKPKKKPKNPNHAIYENTAGKEPQHAEGKKRKVKSSTGDGSQAAATTPKNTKAKPKAKKPKKTKVNSDEEKGPGKVKTNQETPQIADENEHIYESIA